MKKIILLALSIMLFACSGAVVHKINFAKDFDKTKISRIAILNFNRAGGVGVSSELLVDKFTAALINTPYKLVERAELQKIFQEVTFQHSDSGIVDESTKEKLRQLGADTILTGTLHNYSENKDSRGFVLNAEVYLTAKMIKVETGEVLWSAEILKQSRAKNVGEKPKYGIGGEQEADSAGKLLDDIIKDMSSSLKEKKYLIL
ncbi:MAG TPA: CsgG/HfaB family protein [Syntrophorhabdaceae bacterium]|nr:CsgG/HfaB family protein [Syntrophorhabdaceae bacterium]HOL05533.1 CsgG/HfaB family protein [Syntrophorhabdaceae bacterium]HON84899.1 CsgG/HfaB family protein [Syntrophorhabdaceae bacterium]HOT41461.1 CsgG/HfaB family protein [Syntrophorhabdaceae bacterium]HPC65984.1 CsgG/HfaB family protein [Syntrophorhabdaceae bacterium]